MHLAHYSTPGTTSTWHKKDPQQLFDEIINKQMKQTQDLWQKHQRYYITHETVPGALQPSFYWSP